MDDLEHFVLAGVEQQVKRFVPTLYLILSMISDCIDARETQSEQNNKSHSTRM